MNDIESRAREYLAEHSEYSEVFGQTFIAIDTLTAMVEFSEQETKELEKNYNQLLKDKNDLQDLNNNLINKYSKLFAEKEQLSQDNFFQKTKISKAKELLQKCLNTYLRDPELRSEVEGFLKGVEK